MSIKAVIFDMDGTLVDSADIILGAFKHVLDSIGQPYDEAIVRTYIGRTLKDTYGSLSPEHDALDLINAHISWQKENQHLLKQFAGVQELLTELKQRNIKLGLFTSTLRQRVERELNTLELIRYFDAIICGDDISKPKPDKQGVVRTAELLGVKLSETVLVGDAEHDILSGKNAGVTTIAITHGFGTKEALKKAGADYIVNNLKELFALIRKIGM